MSDAEVGPGDSRWALACFDLDGTIVRGTTICQHLAHWLGHVELLTALEERYAIGAVSNAEVANLDAGYYAGKTLEEIGQYLEDIPTIGGIRSTVERLSAIGIPSLLCTVTWRFAAGILAARYGFTGYSGTEMALDAHGRLTGSVSKHFDEHDKLAFVQAYCASQDIPLSRVFAVGDSRSDIPLFGAVGFSVALNATREARAAATVSIDTDDMVEVLAALPTL